MTCLKQDSENREMSKGETAGARVQAVASLRWREVEQSEMLFWRQNLLDLLTGIKSEREEKDQGKV